MLPRQQVIALMRWQDRMKAAKIAGLERYYPFGRDNGKGAASSQAEAETGARHNRLMFWLYRRMTGSSG